MRPVLAASRMSVFVCLILLVSPFARLAAQPEKTNTPQDTPAHRTRNSPAIDLPDLEVERRRAPTHPQAPAPIPSTRRPADIAASDAASTPLQDEIELAALDADDHLRAETPFRFSSRDARRDLSDAAPAALLSARALKRLEDGSRHLNSHLAAGSLADAYEPDIYSASDNHSPERAELKNRTGAPGVDLLSGNYNWSVPILSLPGRSGLNLGLSLSYNSRVWTKSASGTSIGFDSDRGYPTPGFRLGFPSIQTLYYNPTTGQNSLLLITPSGARVELRQVGASNVYEAADSSYLQLTVPGDGMSVVVRTTDGTQLTYWYINGEYRCTEVKDRNGNFITANYNSYGRLSSISDTLGRTVSFVYDANLNLQSIQQQWKRETLTGTVAETHVWATFGYSNLSIQTNFSGLATSIANGKIIPVLTQVGFSDGTRYNFEYTSYGQVSVIRNYSADNYQLSYTTYNLPGSTGAAQTDCPRFTERRFWAVNANNNQEALTTYSFDPAGAWGQVTTPDGTTHKELFAPSGWGKGLTIGTETWAGGVKRKWTTNSWTQDNTALAYMLNPRVFETNIYDESGNRRRTEFTYHGPDKFSLPHETREYAADAATL
ncbi:MAG TPA: hypothetical protein VGV59_05995, partial [Pyrinomonadaceae bacterium]|nr:hypothetical protein [Pyrinomonadaceae bacterium]